MNDAITGKAWKRRLSRLRSLSFNEANSDTTPAELFPFGLMRRTPRDPQYDRETALVAATGVEQGLELAIASKLGGRDDASTILFGDGAVLHDFNAKIKMAYILEIIGKRTTADVQAIRAIRNAFAHSTLVIDFDTPEVTEVISLISIPDREPMTMEGISPNDARERFIQSCFRLHLHLFTYKPGVKTHMPSLLD